MSQSIFNLIENPNDLPSSNENMADLYYREILPTRDVTDTATSSAYSAKFGGTNISIRWNLDNRTWWIPSKSYIKLDLELTKPGDSGDQSLPLTSDDQIAPNMGMGASIFNRMQIKMNDTTISQISQFIPQCDSIAKRVYQSSTWMNKTNGDSSNFWNAYQRKRQQDVSSNGFVSDYTFTSEEVENLPANTRWIITNKQDLGYGPVTNDAGVPTTRISITQAQVLTFTAQNGFVIPNTDTVFQRGDFILVNLVQTGAAPALEAFNRLFIVDTVNADATMSLIGTGIDLGGALGEAGANSGNANITRYRIREDITYYPNKTFLLPATNTQTENTADPTITAAANGFWRPALEQYDVILIQTTAAQAARQSAYILQPSPSYASNLIANVSSYNVTAARVAADVAVRGLKLSEWFKPTSRESLGYDASAQNNSNAFQLVRVAGNDSASNLIQAQNGGTALPDMRNIFDAGDIILFLPQAGALRYLWVESVIDANTTRVSGAMPLAADAGALNDGRNTIVQRLRYNPLLSSLQPNENDLINIAKKKSRFDICWKPSCLSIFNYPGAIPGGTKFELELQAESNKYVGLAIETPFGITKIPRTGISLNNVDYQLLVKNIKFYICQAKGPVVGEQEYSYYINLNEIRTHKRKIQSKSLTQTSLDVMPSSYALALAFQDSRSIDTNQTDQSNTKFTVGGTEANEELSLVRYSLRFAGLSLPQPDAELKFSSTEEFLNNQYIRNQIYTNQYYKSAGGESLEEWKERGIYFYHPFVRSAGNKEARAYIITQFNDDATNGKSLSDLGLQNLQSFLFEFYRAFALIKMKNGFVYSVQTANQ